MIMLRKKTICFSILVVLSLTILTATMVYAQPKGYPGNKPIKLYIPFPAGGGSDVLARVMVSLDYDYFKTNMVPVIKPGASGSIATDFVYHSKPDGYTLLLAAPHMITLLPHIRKVNYDPLKLTYICNINQSNSIAITPKDRPWKTWEEFIAHAKKNPGKLSFGSTGTWGISHVRITAILNSFGVKLVHVPYGGGNAVNQAVIRGEVDFGISSPSYTTPIVKSGDVKALGLVSYRVKALPGVPSFDDLGIKVKMPMWRGVVGPPGMPKEITEYLQKQFAALVADKSFKKTLSKLGEDIVFKAGDEWYEIIKKQYETWGATAKTIAAEEAARKK